MTPTIPITPAETIDLYLEETCEAVDLHFTEGYAMKNPHLVVGLIQIRHALEQDARPTA